MADGTCSITIIRRASGDVHTALVDVEDYDRVVRYGKWSYHSEGYAFYQTPRISRVYMHRLILGLTRGDGLFVDHINGNKLDNRRANLRLLSKARNTYNQRELNERGTSRYRGVLWDKHRSMWRAETRVDGKPHYLGRFSTEQHAYDAVVQFRSARGLSSY